MKANLYDFDGTIYDGDSSIDFYLFCLKKNILLIRFFPYQLLYCILYFCKIINKEKYKQAYFSFLKGIKDINLTVNNFWLQNEKKIKKWYMSKNHKKDIIISASPYFLLLPISKKLKVYDLIATEVDKNTGQFLSHNCRGKEKIKMLYKKHPSISIIEAYTDNISDGPIIEIANKGYFVKKNNIVDYNKISKKDNKEIINYLITGFLTVVVNLIIYYLCTNFFLSHGNQLDIQISNVISWIGAVLFAYFANRIIVFKSKTRGKLFFKELYSFFGARIFTLLVEMLLMYLFISLFLLNDFISKVIVQFVVIVLNYVISKIIVFKKKIYKNNPYS
ncbi:MAG: GtrA family protein [Bacilli bacterium]